MAALNTNEREFQGDVLDWFRQALSTPITSVTQETSVEGLFPDVICWIDREAYLALATAELKDTLTGSRDEELVQNGAKKGRNLKARYLITWNMREAIVWSLRTGSVSELWHYDPIDIPGPKDWRKFLPELKSLAARIISDLVNHSLTGALPKRARLESTVFAHGIYDFVQRLEPLYAKVLQSNRKEVIAWAAQQGISTDEGLDVAIRHVVYELVGRMFFYHTLSQFRGELPSLSIPDRATPDHCLKLLRQRFDSARRIDYEALFMEKFSDKIPITPEITDLIREYCSFLSRMNLKEHRDKPDIVGSIFEQLVPPEEKHRLGQYFTEPILGDLLCSFAIRSSNDVVFDPTCGTGGILLRAYQFLQHLDASKKHPDLLDQLWGVDIGDFPTALGMINLFSKSPSETSNFPRVVKRDIFDVSPGVVFKMPPHKGGGGIGLLEVQLPAADAIVGNPPYIRYQNIGDGYRSPDKYRQSVRSRFPGFLPESDLYTYVFAQALLHLKPGGRLAFVTSNSWLESEYGLELQRFFLQNFLLVAIVESRCEPWFQNVDVNTVVTVLEKPKKPLPETFMAGKLLAPELSKNLAAFVRVKRPLSDIAGLPCKPQQALDRLIGFVNEVERAPDGITDTEDHRISKLPQQTLRDDLPEPGGVSKWGVHLRAPNSYLRIHRSDEKKMCLLSKHVDTMFGTLTGLNDFYCPSESDAAYALFKPVESKYKVPLVRSIKDCDSYVITKKNASSHLFVCNTPLSALSGTAAKKYVDWGSHQSTDGVLWPKKGEMARRTPWYSTRKPVRGEFVFQMIVGDRHFTPFNPEKFPVLNNCLAGLLRKGADEQLLAAILNSTWFALTYELHGRINLGSGALKIEKADLDVMRIPDPEQFSKDQAKRAKRAFATMLGRGPFTIDKEILQPDRRDLDEEIFSYLQLTHEERNEVRFAAVQLAKDRTTVREARKHVRDATKAVDVETVMQDVLHEAAPNGLRAFPEDFVPAGRPGKRIKVPSSGLSVVDLPSAPGQYDMFKGHADYVLRASTGSDLRVGTPEEVNFLILSQNGSDREVEIPREKSLLGKAVSEYLKYVESIRAKIAEIAFLRAQSQKRADQITTAAMETFGRVLELPDLSIKKGKKKK